MNEIIERWKALEDLDKEHALFEAYVKAREEYLAAVRAAVKSPSTSDSLHPLYLKERQAFTAYLTHRLQIRPEDLK